LQNLRQQIKTRAFSHHPDREGKNRRQLTKLTPHFVIRHLKYSMTSRTITITMARKRIVAAMQVEIFY